MAEDLTETEAEQIRRLTALHKVVTVIMAKWLWLIALMFVLGFVAFSAFLVWHSAKSVHRFSAETKLIYSPRKIEKFENMSDRQLMSVLDRNSLKRKVGNLVLMPPTERQCLTLDLSIKQGLKQSSNIFTLKAQSGTWKGAVDKVNAYAEILVEEYIVYRKRDITAQCDSIEQRKKRYQEQLTEVDSEETMAKSRLGVATPVEMLITINALLSDQRRNLSLLGVQVANEEVRKKRLESEVGTIGNAVIANAASIKKKSAEIAYIDAEIARLREDYTDLNPKVIGKLQDREAKLKAYAEFLKAKGIKDVPIEELDRIERSALELATVVTKLDVLAESQRSLEIEIKANEKKSAELTAVVSVLERLRGKRTGIEQTIKDVDEQLDSLGYLMAALDSDLRQIERAGGAGDSNPLRGKNFIFSLGGAFVIALVTTFWIVLFEFVFGKVRNSAEMAAWGDVLNLGSIPKPGAMEANQEKDAMGVVALNFCNENLPKGIVLICRLPGAEEQPKFREALDWSLAMGGHRPFILNIVRSIDFNPPEDCQSLITAVYKDSHGWFPVENFYTMAPAEVQMLQADLAEIKNSFDEVFILMPNGFCKGGNFLDQLLAVCDSALLFVGAETTPRTDFSYARRHAKAAERPMSGIMVGAPIKDVLRDMEAGK